MKKGIPGFDGKLFAHLLQSQKLRRRGKQISILLLVLSREPSTVNLDVGGSSVLLIPQRATWGWNVPSERPRNAGLAAPQVEASVLCGWRTPTWWHWQEGGSEKAQMGRDVKLLKKVMGSEVAMREGTSDLNGNQWVTCWGSWDTGSEKVYRQNPGRPRPRPQCHRLTRGLCGWPSGSTTGWCDVCESKGGGSSISDPGWTERVFWVWAQVCWGGWRWREWGKWKKKMETNTCWAPTVCLTHFFVIHEILLMTLWLVLFLVLVYRWGKRGLGSIRSFPKTAQVSAL